MLIGQNSPQGTYLRVTCLTSGSQTEVIIMEWKGNSVGEDSMEEEGEKFWVPTVERGSGRSPLQGVRGRDWYAAVEHVGGGMARLAVTGWPTLDRGGGLLFEKSDEHVYWLPELQGVVNRARAASQQPDPDRPLEVGDAFWIRSGVRPGQDLVEFGFEGLILDITESAREQARGAMNSEFGAPDPSEA
jgi:hypothetical protein